MICHRLSRPPVIGVLIAYDIHVDSFALSLCLIWWQITVVRRLPIRIGTRFLFYAPRLRLAAPLYGDPWHGWYCQVRRRASELHA